jgi:hypothetical protein
LLYFVKNGVSRLMMQAANILVSILRNAWGALIGLMVAVAILALLMQILRLAGSAAIGASLYVNQAVGSITSLIVVVLYAFLAIPAIVHSVSLNAASRGCGPVAELGAVAAYVMAAISAVRMAKAAFVSLLSALAGAEGGISYAVTEALEVLLGTVLVTAAVPIAAALLGAC